ncbi:hypothetical protein PHYBOEH_005179 [Phytophthora boehmeriae]|uniref:Uncharacterized protein n=1 Tax=Phytophthora boehmeriae TaxID=109152 RepID=A0A8T1WM02_9STRA|nr:hypothetical protein PHYBOEH_005179 [Phytophthora boehmeriae]
MIAGALTTLAFLAEHGHRRSSVMKAVGVYGTGAMAARVVEALGVPRKAVELGQVALFSAAMAVVFRGTSPGSSRMLRMLYGYSDEDSAGQESAAKRRRNVNGD